MYRSFALMVLALTLGACGGGGAPSPIPEAHAAEPVSPCPLGDATAQLQAMVDTAKSGRLDLPPCTFNTSETIVIRKPLLLVGSNATVNGTIIRSTANEAVLLEPDVRINVALGPNKRGWHGGFRDLRIEPAIQGGGQHGLVLRVKTGFFLNNWEVTNLHIGDFGQQGVWLDNSAGNVDGIFTGRITGSWIENGILGTLIGDSVHIINNVIGNGVSRMGKQGLPAVDISTVPGAAESSIQLNSMTTSGGCVLVRNGIGIGVLNNWCESSGTGSASGLLQLVNCAECTVRDNRVQVLSKDVAYALVLDGGELTLIDSNKFNIGNSGHVAITNGAKLYVFAGLNRFNGGGDILTGVVVKVGQGS